MSEKQAIENTIALIGEQKKELNKLEPIARRIKDLEDGIELNRQHIAWIKGEVR